MKKEGVRYGTASFRWWRLQELICSLIVCLVLGALSGHQKLYLRSRCYVVTFVKSVDEKSFSFLENISKEF